MGVAAAALMLSSFAPGGAEAGEQTFQQIDRLLGAWQVQEAGELIDEFADDADGTPHLHYVKARHAFKTGDYDEAQDQIEQSVEMQPHEVWSRYQEIVDATVEVTEDYERHVSESGNFEMYVEPGPDAVLVPYALEALEKAYDRIGEILDHHPDEPVRVEVYPRETVLAKVSELTEENIRTSGTIALCQYNRLMITSPRAVLRGYSWVDTLVHEYVHLVINQRTVEQVPIWMHEGLAKYLERQWRGEDEQLLEGAAEKLLRERHEDDSLVTFEEMHPSMAMLPSQQDAAVAFAQVYTTMEYLDEEVGDGAFSQLLDEIDRGYEAREAYARVVGMGWDEFEDHEWRRYLHHRPLPDLPEDADDLHHDQIVFDGDESAGDEESLQELDTPEAEEYLQLGQMFQVRDRYGAAAVQYQKAADLMGDKNPLLQTRMARSLTNSGDPEKAIEALKRVNELNPYHVNTWLELGRAHRHAGNYEEAREALREAARVNPFNPEIHEYLSQVADELGDSEEASQARRFADKTG